MRTKILCFAAFFIVAMLFGSLPNTAHAFGRIIIVRPGPVVVHQRIVVYHRPIIFRPVIVRPIIRRPIFMVHPVYVAPPVPHHWQNFTQQQQVHLNNSNNNVINVNNAGTVPPPVPFSPPVTGGAVAFGDSAVLAGVQQAVIAWNGKTDETGEQTLIVTTNEMSNTGQNMAVLSVLPLPGKPISIEPANTRVFTEAKVLLNRKIQEQRPDAGGEVVGFGVIMATKIGSHNIFVWEMEDTFNELAFQEDIVAHIADVYGNIGNEVTALFTNKTLEVIKGYHDRGFRYFAFDITEVKNEVSTKEAIAYRFHSPYAYYPLAISGVGGTGHGLIDIIVMTPGAINLGGALQGVTSGGSGPNIDLFVHRGNATVDFTMNEVRQLDPSLAAVFDGSGLNSVRVRNFLFNTGNIGGFTNDFIATPAR